MLKRYIARDLYPQSGCTFVPTTRWPTAGTSTRPPGNPLSSPEDLAEQALTFLQIQLSTQPRTGRSPPTAHGWPLHGPMS